MIDGIGRSPPPRSIAATADANVKTGGGAARVADQAPAVSVLGRIARELSASPPVDTTKVETLRNAIASGAYKPDAGKIAVAMLALETVPPPA